MCNIPHCCLPQESGPCLSPNVAGHPLRPAADRSLGGPLPRQQTNQTRAHPVPPELSRQGHAALPDHAVLAAISGCCPPARGRLPTRDSPVRHSVIRASSRGNPRGRFVRLACVRHAASVHPEPGSNSHVQVFSRSEPVWHFIKSCSVMLIIHLILHCFKGALLFFCKRCCSRQKPAHFPMLGCPSKNLLIKIL